MAVLREFVRKHTAITADPHGNNKAPPSGYFRFDVGPTTKKARKAQAANVPWGETEATYAAVHARLTMLLRDGAPRVWIRAIESSDTSPVDSIDLYGDPADPADDDDDEKSPKGRHALVEGHAHVVTALTRLTEKLVERVVTEADQRAELHTYGKVWELVATARQDASMTESVRALTSALGPGVSASIPLVVAAMLKSYGYDPSAAVPTVDATAEPGVQVDQLTDQVDALFQRIVALCMADPGLVTAARVDRWRAMVARTFGGGQAPPTPADEVEPPADTIDAGAP